MLSGSGGLAGRVGPRNSGEPGRWCGSEWCGCVAEWRWWARV